MGVIFRNGIPYGGINDKEQFIEAEEHQFLVGDGTDWAKGGNFKELKIINNEAKDGRNGFFFTNLNNNNNNQNQIKNAFYFGGDGKIEEENAENDVKKKFNGSCYLTVKDSAIGEFTQSSHFIAEGTSFINFKDNASLLMTGRSDLRLKDGVILRAEKNNNIIEYTFGDESDSNNQVTFSVSELKALKALLTRTWTGSESDYQNIQNPDSNTLYYTWDDNE